MTDVPYTHGHHDSVLRSHRWRTAENSAGYLLAHLRPGMSVLDIGCGPGTITTDLARRVAPGRVVGVDASPQVIEEARSLAADSVNAPDFAVGNLFELDGSDGGFDVVHAHQVLQHVGDPVEGLRRMRRLCRQGGIVAARDSDYPAMTFFPPDPDLDRALVAYRAATLANGANCDAGRMLLRWGRLAGFGSVEPSASVWCFATPDDRAWWGGLWSERFTHSALAEQLRSQGIVTEGELQAISAAWLRWASDEDGWFTVLHGEVICRD
jgi:SAM-dependent methyltransferase